MTDKKREYKTQYINTDQRHLTPAQKEKAIQNSLNNLVIELEKAAGVFEILSASSDEFAKMMADTQKIQMNLFDEGLAAKKEEHRLFGKILAAKVL